MRVWCRHSYHEPVGRSQRRRRIGDADLRPREGRAFEVDGGKGEFLTERNRLSLNDDLNRRGFAFRAA
jgi:hypothetical protein